MSDTNFLQRGLALVSNGYRIIPIRPGEKRPGMLSWQDVHATDADVRKWAGNGFANGNIGIITANNPAIDIDVYEASVSEAMQEWCLANLGDTPIRIGQAPKRLLMYTSSEPFTKMFSEYLDQAGKKHKVEILGDGQQFVAYGIHPDTKKPFQWVSMDEPLDTPADMVPALTVNQARAALEHFGVLAKAAGWTFKNSSEGRTSMVVGGKTDDDALLTHKPTLKLTMTEITDALGFVDDADQYDRWVMVGMALHHQSRGKTGGLDVWKEWSSQAHNYDPDACDSKWDTFKDNSGKTNPVTFASVLKIAHEREKVAKTEEFARVMNVLRTCNDEQEIFGPIAKLLVDAVTQDYQLDIVAKKMQERVKEITGVNPRIETVRKALASAKGRSEVLDGGAARPDWCKGWVYLKNADKFYHVDSKSEMSERGFNAVFDRMLISDEDKLLGNALPASRASSMALNLYNMPTIDQKVYLPGMEKILDFNGRMCVNTFDETSVPQSKEPETQAEHDAIETIENHFRVLLPKDSERNMVLDFLAYNVQFPAEKIVWAVVMQGAEGAGKTVLMKMLARVMGPQNVGPLSATELQDKYTGWAENKKMVFVEEIRLHGANRYEIMDKLKPFITNEEANIRRMNQDAYEIPNVTNYFMFTNYWDALPLSRMDRRYYVVGTWFQTKEQLDEWNQKYPNYFGALYAAIQDHADVLRHWLLTRELSPSFQPKRPAPDSVGKTMMRDQSEHSDESDALADTLESSTDPEVSDRLLNADKLKAAMDMSGVVVPYGRAFSMMLAKAGFHLLGRFRVSVTQPPVRFYSRQPHLFAAGFELVKIREIQGVTPALIGFDNLDGDPFA